MNKQEAIAEIARLTKVVDSTLTELQAIADEHDIALRLDALGDQWYEPVGTGDAARPSIEMYYEGEYKGMTEDEWEEAHPEWDHGYAGWQNSSTFC